MKYLRYLLFIYYLTVNSISSAMPIDQKESKFEVRLAVVDIQSILEHSLALQDIRKLIDQFNQKIQQDISKKDSELRNVEEKLIQKRDTLSANAFEEEVNKFHKKVSEAQKDIQVRKNKLEQAHAEAVGKVHEITIDIVANLAKKYNLNLVLPSTQILYAKNNLNITAEVINLLNNKIKSVKINYP